MPCSQGSKGSDHNLHAFTSWLAGGGIKPGVRNGQSDECDYKVAENLVYCYDAHATVLHLLDIDHKRLMFRRNGIDRRLTDVHGHVIDGILAWPMTSLAIGDLPSSALGKPREDASWVPDSVAVATFADLSGSGRQFRRSRTRSRS